MTTARARFADRIASWWNARGARERAMVGGLGAVLLVAALVTLVIRPLQAARAAALADIRAYDMLAARLRATAPGAALPATRRTGDLAAIVAASAARFAVPVRGVVPQGAGVRVQALGVAYGGLVRWLADLRETGGVRVAYLQLGRAAAPGEVDATMVLVR